MKGSIYFFVFFKSSSHLVTFSSHFTFDTFPSGPGFTNSEKLNG